MKINPIFIMGAPRSGTTLLASMIASRDDAIALPEMHYIHNLFKEEALYGPLEKKYVIASLKNDFTFLELGIIKSNDEISELVGLTFRKTVLRIVEAYNRKYFQKDYKLWVEHSPHNHKYFYVLKHNFPNAKFVHIIRDGRAVYSSTIEQMWGYKDIITGANSWKESVEDCLSLSLTNPDQVFTLRYEDLTLEPEESIKSLCEFLDIPFSKSMLESRGLILTEIDQGRAKQTGSTGRPNTKSLGKWKSRLTKSEVGHFTNINKQLLEHFGYKVEQYSGKEFRGFRKWQILITGRLKQLYFYRRHIQLRNKSVGIK